MKRTESQIRAEMLAAAGESIDKLLAWVETAEAPTLTQIEDEVLGLRQRLGEQLAQIMVEEQADASTGGSARMSRMRRSDDCQGEQAQNDSESSGDTGNRTQSLLLSPLQERGFPPWTSNLNWMMHI